MDDKPQYPKTGDASATDGWQWVMVTDPSQSRDRKTMRDVRTHVMNNYLHKEQMNPNSTDIRVRKFNPQKSRPQAISAPSSYVGAAEESDEVLETPTRDLLSRGGLKRRESAQNIPDLPLCGLGNRYDAFRLMPRFDNQDIDVEMLKSNCTTFFGSRAMGTKWVPFLIKSRTTFLSTLCIASPYLDLMKMEAWNPTNPRASGSVETVRTLSVRSETVRMIGQDLSDPETCSNDSNIVAVLQMFCGDMMVGEDQTMLLHEQGMWSMVEQRGGLNRLDGDGTIATMISIQVFELYIFRECRPRQEYLDYASRYSKSVGPNRRSAFLESPLYFPYGALRAIHRKGLCSGDTLELIKAVKDLTQVVLDLKKSSTLFGPSPAELEDTGALEIRRNDLVLRTLNFPHDTQDAIYEATRLCARLYATAIRQNKSLSETARSMETIEGTGGIVIAIRRQLMRSDLSTCWGKMGGVLFWILLVSSAACNENSNRPVTSEHNGIAAENRRIKKWFIALIVRCTILLGFQHTDAILRSLQTLLIVQDVLRSREDSFLTTSQAQGGSPDGYNNLSIQGEAWWEKGGL